MIFTPLLITSDQSIGRVGKSAFSQEALLVIIYSKFTTNAERVLIDRDEPVECRNFQGITLSYLSIITMIDWSFRSIEGSLALEWLPETIEFAHFDINRLSGKISLVNLPDPLVSLTVGENQFVGTIDLTQLPKGLKNLTLSANKFEGSVELSQLPESMNQLNVCGNVMLSG